MVFSWQKSQNTEPVKALPRSVMILLGTPKRCLMSLMNLTALLTLLGEFVYDHQYMFVATTASRPHIAKGHDGGMVCRA
jgi:hypothetical protein